MAAPKKTVTPAKDESAASPVTVNVRTVVVRSGTASLRTVESAISVPLKTSQETKPLRQFTRGLRCQHVRRCEHVGSAVSIQQRDNAQLSGYLKPPGFGPVSASISADQEILDG
jgi:hypothetical protein